MFLTALFRKHDIRLFRDFHFLPMASQVDIRHGRNGDDLGGAVGGDADIHKLTEVWCDDDAIKPYFIAAGKALKYGNLRRQLSDSLENKPFPSLPEELQKNTYFEFGSIEDHFKYAIRL